MTDNATTEHVISVLGELLEYPDLTAEDDFFDRGGHSLLVIRAIALLRERHGLAVPARAFIADSRIGAIAEAAV